MAAPLRLTTLCAALCVAAAVCPSSEWQPYRGLCYWASPSPLEWRSVVSVCALQFPGSQPVSVHDTEVNAFLADQVLNFTSGWLGLQRPNESRGWLWSDGSAYDWYNWEAGQPHGDGERCAFLHQGQVGGWRDGDCSISYVRFICQTEDQPITTTETPATTVPTTETTAFTVPTEPSTTPLPPLVADRLLDST